MSVHTDELGLFSGQVHVIPYHKNRAKRTRATELVKSIRADIAGFRKGGDIDALRARIQARLSQIHALQVLTVDFELYRTGELRITTDPRLPRDLCDQAYYLIKDMAHRHYHHSHADDSLLPLTPVRGEDDQSWRRRTLWSLARVVLEARRRDRLEGYKSALGMLAYAEAFQSLLGRVYRTGVGPAQFDFVNDTPSYDFAHTRSSLEAKIAEREYKLSARSQSFALWMSTVIGTIALWISAVQIASPLCQAINAEDKVCQVKLPHLTSHAVKFLIERPHEGYGLLLLIVLLYLGRRTLALFPVAFYEYLVISWSQALGASASRAAGANDRLGQIVVIVTALLFGALMMALAGAISGVLPIKAAVSSLITHLQG